MPGKLKLLNSELKSTFLCSISMVFPNAIKCSIDQKCGIHKLCITCWRKIKESEKCVTRDKKTFQPIRQMTFQSPKMFPKFYISSTLLFFTFIIFFATLKKSMNFKNCLFSGKTKNISPLLLTGGNVIFPYGENTTMSIDLCRNKNFELSKLKLLRV